MPIHPPPTNTTTPATTNFVPPPQPTPASPSIFDQIAMWLTPPYVFVPVGIMIALMVLVLIFYRKWYYRDPVGRGLIKQLKLGKGHDAVVVNIDIDTRNVQLMFAKKLTATTYTAHDGITGEELIIPVTSDSMVGLLTYGNITRPVIITVRKSANLPFTMHIEHIANSVPIQHEGLAEVEELAHLAEVKAMLQGYITLSPTTRLVIAVDPRKLLSSRLSQELTMLSSIPIMIKEIDKTMVKLLKLQNERIRMQNQRTIMLIFVSVIAGILVLMTLANLGILKL